MKMRLDQLLVERGLCPSRERARTTIMSGLVYVNGQKEDKPGHMASPEVPLEVRGDPVGYVSRGGLKLEKALDTFEINVSGRLALDAGASTGGFTDCLLKRGASKVWAVDVGYGQLAWTLRQDPRVEVMERTNVRYLMPEHIGEPVSLAVMDLSFISLRLILPSVFRLVADNADAVCLVKPQFEAGRDKVGKKGVVRDPNTHREVLTRFVEFAGESGFAVLGLTFSPLRGPDGNIEFLAHLRRGGAGAPLEPSLVVDQAHRFFQGESV